MRKLEATPLRKFKKQLLDCEYTYEKFLGRELNHNEENMVFINLMRLKLGLRRMPEHQWYKKYGDLKRIGVR